MVKHSAPKTRNSFPNEMEMGSVANYATEEFLDHLRRAACDVCTAGRPEIAMLRSWVTSFIRENGSWVHSILDLVDQEDILDSPLRGLIKPKKEGRVAKGPEVSEGFSPRKKKSMAELIGVMDVEMETLEGKSVAKKRKSRRSLEEERVLLVEEEIGSSKRERRKSKYLSPPYTFLSGPGKQLDEGEDEDKESEQLDEDEEEEEKTRPLYESASMLFLQLLCAARDPLQLKWNGLSEKSMGFFAEFRNMVSSGNQEFDAYQKHLKNSVDENVVYNDKGTSLVRIIEVKDEASREGRRNTARDQASERTPMNLSWRSGKKNKGSVNGDAAEDLDCKPVKSSVEGLPQQKSNTNHGLVDSSRLGNPSPRRRKNTEELGCEFLTGCGYTATNGTEDGGSRPKRRKREGNVVGESGSPLPYIRENLERMISTLARPLPKSSGELKPEVRENLVSEMQSLLNKVKDLMAGIPGVC